MAVDPILKLAFDVRMGQSAVAERQITERLRTEFDTNDDNDVSFQAVLTQTRVTLANALDEARHPAPDDTSEEMLSLLARTSMVASLHRVMEDHLYDFNLLERHHTLHDLFNAYHEGERYNRIQRRDRRDVFTNFAKRVSEDFISLRRAEMQLRMSLKAPWRDVDPGNRACNPEELVCAAFDSALRLESFYEDRVFGPHS